MRRLFLACMCGLASCGCVVYELRNDQEKIHAAVLDLYTDQIMDNLVRAANGLPIIQLEYTNASANVTLKDTASLNDSLTTTHTNLMTTAAAVTLMVTRTTMNTIMGGLSNDHTNQIGIAANPVTNSVELYNAYLQFLALPDHLQITVYPPPAGVAHIVMNFREKYYWVPVSCKDDFYRLALCTSVERGRLLVPPPDTYSITIKSIVSKTWEGTEWAVTAKVDKRVPNAPVIGTLTFSDGTTAKVAYQPPKPTTADKTIEYTRLFLADTILFYLNPTHGPMGATHPDDLPLPLSATLNLGKRYRPPPPSTKELLDLIPFFSPSSPNR